MSGSKAGTPQDPVQRKVVSVLVFAQILGGIGMGATLSLGALLAAETSGSSAWSGMAATMSTLGAATAAVPLATLARNRGRRVSLSTGATIAGGGAILAVVAASLSLFWLLLLSLALLGAGGATSLQARFAATDLAAPGTRGRDLSIVVWSTTVGAVLGPNLFEPGQAVAAVFGLPALSGGFLFSIAAQAGAAIIYAVGLRPDPLLTALERSTTTHAGAIAARTADAGIPGSGGRAGAGGSISRGAGLSGPQTNDDGGGAGNADAGVPSDSAAGAKQHGPRGLVILRRNPTARYAVGSIAISHSAMVALMSMTPVHLHDAGATLGIVGLTISLHVAGMYGLSPLFGWLSDRAGRIRTIVLGQVLLLGALFLAWIGAESQGAVTASLILLGLGWSASVVSGSTLLADSVPLEERAAVQGSSDLLMNSAGALGGALAGPVLTLVGYAGLGLCAMALVVAVLAWTTLRSR
ncbi:MFS transporter [Arthrobacter sp. H41]|uniref:MFS transporter n=1 Tax=Arthrobacter sp. H41 TaxID=1312978 RepID=UPI0004B81AA4|nr:MFS transporter [Arthrobacter sp. H41]